MENIKFKGKSKWDKSEVFGLLTYSSDSHSIIKTLEGNEVSVYSESVAQFTGLLDKNGNEIYCKDRFKVDVPEYDSHGHIFEVKFLRGAFGYLRINLSNEPDEDEQLFTSFSEFFIELKGKGNQLFVVELINQ